MHGATVKFDEECSGFLDQSKQANMQWVQDPNQNSVDCTVWDLKLVDISGTKGGISES
jgi:hypothetical protein